jgi:hypothetical protein
MPEEVVGALIGISGFVIGSVVTAIVTIRVEATRQRAENTQQERALAAERQRAELEFVHESQLRKLDWRRGERKVVVDRARSFLDEVSVIVQQIGLARASQAMTGEPTESRASFWIWQLGGALNRHGGVWLSVPDAELGQLLRDLAVAPIVPGWMPSPDYENLVTAAYRRLEEVAALLDLEVELS